jgi:hypothetical protein
MIVGKRTKISALKSKSLILLAISDLRFHGKITNVSPALAWEFKYSDSETICM